VRLYLFISKIFFLSLLVLFTSCEENQPSIQKNSNYSNILHAENFKIIHRVNFVELQIFDPEKKRVERSYALVSKNQASNVLTNLPRIEVPVEGLVCLSATHIGMLNKLHAIDFVKGISNKKYLENKELVKLVATKKVKEFESIDQLNPERILNSGANVVVYDGFGTFPANETKLQKLGVVCIPNYDWRETDPLGKAEWIKLFGLLTGKQLIANKYFDRIAQKYMDLKKEATTISKHPSLMSGSLIGDAWYMPSGQSFLANILKDAQLDYVEKNVKGTGSVSLSFEHCLNSFQNSSVWINPGFSSRKKLIQMNPKYRFFKAFQTKEIYCYSHNANYFWENSAVEPQHLLSDFIEINKGIASTKKLYFYRKLAE